MIWPLIFGFVFSPILKKVWRVGDVPGKNRREISQLIDLVTMYWPVTICTFLIQFLEAPMRAIASPGLGSVEGCIFFGISCSGADVAIAHRMVVCTVVASAASALVAPLCYYIIGRSILPEPLRKTQALVFLCFGSVMIFGGIQCLQLYISK